MKLQLTEFNETYLTDAAELLCENQNTAMKKCGADSCLTTGQCCRIIKDELKKDISCALMLFHEDRLIGFAVSVLKKDSTWGRSGWVNIGGWALKSDYSDYITLLYRKVAEEWVKQGVLQHYFLVFAENRALIDTFSELGFAKEQAHAVLNLSRADLKKADNEALVVRKAVKSDQNRITGFSRIIAGYQKQSPCFASAPEEYLKDLDRGFSELTEDEEAQLYIAEENNELIGLEVFYTEETSHVLVPENSAELAVCSVREEYRGRGAGSRLTDFACSEIKRKGFDYVVTDWRCANLLSGTFWKNRGFIPVAYRLLRRIDPLILE